MCRPQIGKMPEEEVVYGKVHILTTRTYEFVDDVIR